MQKINERIDQHNVEKKRQNITNNKNRQNRKFINQIFKKNDIQSLNRDYDITNEKYVNKMQMFLIYSFYMKMKERNSKKKI